VGIMYFCCINVGWLNSIHVNPLLMKILINQRFATVLKFKGIDKRVNFSLYLKNELITTTNKTRTLVNRVNE
jgi:hypothetical protein